MRTSISTTSGRSRRASRTASRAVGGLAEHVDPVAALEDRAQPGAHELLVVGDEHRRHAAPSSGSVRADDEPAAGRPGAERAVRDPDALAHARRARARRRRRGAGSRPPQRVADLDGDRRALTRDRDLGRRARVAEHVRQRLLHDAVGGQVDPGGRPRERRRRPADDRHPGSSGLLDERLELREARLGRDCGGLAVVAQDPEQAAQLPERLPRGAGDRLERRRRRARARRRRPGPPRPARRSCSRGGRRCRAARARCGAAPRRPPPPRAPRPARGACAGRAGCARRATRPLNIIAGAVRSVSVGSGVRAAPSADGGERDAEADHGPLAAGVRPARVQRQHARRQQEHHASASRRSARARRRRPSHQPARRAAGCGATPARSPSAPSSAPPPGRGPAISGLSQLSACASTSSAAAISDVLRRERRRSGCTARAIRTAQVDRVIPGDDPGPDRGPTTAGRGGATVSPHPDRPRRSR